MGELGAFITAALPLLSLLMSGTPIGAAVSAISFTQWVTLGVSVAEAGPAVAGALPKIIAAAHPALAALKPAFEQFVTDLFKDDGGPQEAAANIRAWLAANADTVPTTIPTCHFRINQNGT